MPFTLSLNYDKTKLHTIQPIFLKQDEFQVYDQLLQNVLLQTPHITVPADAQFPHQYSSKAQIIYHLKIFEETTVSIRNNFPQNDQISHKQKFVDLLTIIFRSSSNQFSLVDEDSDDSQLSFFTLIFFNNNL